ncbi:MAG TPA: hypothetical protein VGR56_01155 [Nitrososphaerales archaeon]|nr:hypothetical protein [Nitrososphaerales archaeon]
MWAKFVSFKPLQEEWYYYKLPDGTTLKVRYHLRHLMRQHFSGILYPLGQYQSFTDTIGQDWAAVHSSKFPYPKLVKKGVSEYITPEGQTLCVRPSFYEAIRNLDSKGNPFYDSQVYWIVDQSMKEIMVTLARQSTFVTVGGTKASVVEGLVKEKEILEGWFTKEWFQNARNSRHPAFTRWSACNQAILWGGSKPDSLKFEGMVPIAKVALDASLLVRLTDGDLRQLSLGKLEAFGDEDVQETIRRRKLVSKQFEDLWVELYTAAWHKRVGRKITLLEGSGKGLPDIRVDIDPLSYPIFIECKRPKVFTSKKIQKEINIASNQIKAVSTANTQAYGVLLLDITALLGDFQAIDNSIPHEIQAVLDVVQSSLKGLKNTHIKSAVVVWHDFNISGEIPQPVILTYGRRAKILNHEKNEAPLERGMLFEGNASRLLMQQTPDEFLPENAGR